MSSYFPMTGYRATLCASRVDNLPDGDDPDLTEYLIGVKMHVNREISAGKGNQLRRLRIANEKQCIKLNATQRTDCQSLII